MPHGPDRAASAHAASEQPRAAARQSALSLGLSLLELSLLELSLLDLYLLELPLLDLCLAIPTRPTLTQYKPRSACALSHTSLELEMSGRRADRIEGIQGPINWGLS